MATKNHRHVNASKQEGAVVQAELLPGNSTPNRWLECPKCGWEMVREADRATHQSILVCTNPKCGYYED